MGSSTKTDHGKSEAKPAVRRHGAIPSRGERWNDSARSSRAPSAARPRFLNEFWGGLIEIVSVTPYGCYGKIAGKSMNFNALRRYECGHPGVPSLLEKEYCRGTA